MKLANSYIAFPGCCRARFQALRISDGALYMQTIRETRICAGGMVVCTSDACMRFKSHNGIT